MDKPTPKYELVIKVDKAFRLFLIPSTNDARGWIEREARAFGSLYDEMEDFGHYWLVVRPYYDILEVALYLAQMGSDDTAEVLVMRGDEILYPIPPTETPEQPS